MYVSSLEAIGYRLNPVAGPLPLLWIATLGLLAAACGTAVPVRAQPRRHTLTPQKLAKCNKRQPQNRPLNPNSPPQHFTRARALTDIFLSRRGVFKGQKSEFKTERERPDA